MLIIITHIINKYYYIYELLLIAKTRYKKFKFYSQYIIILDYKEEITCH